MATAIGIVQQVDWDVPEQTGLWSDAWVRFRRNPLAVAGLAVIVVMIVLAIGARLPTNPGGLWHVLHLTGDPVQQEVTNTYALPSLQHPLGTDVLGRDQLSRILYGASISLTIGIVVQFLILIIGGVIGMVAGYFGGWIDNLLMRFTDIMYAFPDLLLVLVFVAAFGPSFWSIFIALGLVYWVGLARLVRGQVLSIKEKEYVEAAIMTGTSPFKLIVKHLVPNSLGPVIVTLTFGIPAAIFTEAALSFLGIGIRPPEPSWGVMIEDGYAGIFADPRQVIFPGIAVALTMLSFTFVGDGLRDALDPRMRR
ncbi:MAG: ABC transporter permease [Chloroflexi bacterium]|nr:MAG: ABC transporter permease [Chloroflexota bacterium]TMF79974.1 MAG: ABC transporter permease [Chloroflexota bacterium]TMF93087.1 MAG: ABC transporter permease [Chloroflexota bacterium]TMG44945.1 MAG: ABC transporter permease [Chloroflexota bacterium]